VQLLRFLVASRPAMVKRCAHSTSTHSCVRLSAEPRLTLLIGNGKSQNPTKRSALGDIRSEPSATVGTGSQPREYQSCNESP
jgi:hypothetical protein